MTVVIDRGGILKRVCARLINVRDQAGHHRVRPTGIKPATCYLEDCSQAVADQRQPSFEVTAPDREAAQLTDSYLTVVARASHRSRSLYRVRGVDQQLIPVISVL